MTQPELELDESEMFGDGEESGDETTVLQAPAPAGEVALLSALASSGSASAGAAASSESESDDDGIRLDTEPSSSDEKEESAEEVRGMLISPAQSKGVGPLSPGALAAPVPSTSAVGSLHRMGSVGGQREYLSAIDLTSALRESAAIVAPRRRAGTDSPPQLPCHLGTSMPISIPMLQRRSSSARDMMLMAGEMRTTAATFVPPHLLDRDPVELGRLGVTYGGQSPSAAVARERLLVRNQILRSTGFLETAPPTSPVGETLDVIKESVTSMSPLGVRSARPSGPCAVPARGQGPRRVASSLTQMLSSSQ